MDVILLLTLLLGLALLLAFFGRHKSLSALGSRRHRSAVLLVGPSGAGKTAIYAHLRYPSKTANTLPSVRHNEWTFSTDAHNNGGNQCQLVDIPGHPKLRHAYADYSDSVVRILFVLDSQSSAVLSSLRATAEYLYDILANPTIRAEKIPVTVVCHKQDSLLAFKKDKLQHMLQEEIDRLRQTKSRQVSSQLSTAEDDDHAHFDQFLGFDDKSFEFSQLENEVEFIETSLQDLGLLAEISRSV